MSLIKNENGNGGINIIGLLGVCFIVLKLTGFIDWSWIWVLAPFWAGIAITLLVFAFMGLVVLLGKS